MGLLILTLTLTLTLPRHVIVSTFGLDGSHRASYSPREAAPGCAAARRSALNARSAITVPAYGFTASATPSLFSFARVRLGLGSWLG